MKKFKVIERHAGLLGRYATVELDGKRYFCGVERGKSVRIAYKPRGQNRGWKWSGFVRDAQGRTVWSGEVNKSTGVPTLLRAAGVLAKPADVSAEAAEASLTEIEEGRGRVPPHPFHDLINKKA